MSELTETAATQFARATKVINTAACWEIHGKFSIIFTPDAELFRFKDRAGIRIVGTRVYFEAVRITQAYKKDYFRIRVGSEENSLRIPHNLIVEVFDEEEHRALWCDRDGE